MIVVKIWAGLANKMFQYAFYLSLKKKGFDVTYDSFSYKPNWDFENSHLSDIFINIDEPHDIIEMIKNSNYPLSNGYYDKLRRFLFRKFKIRIGFKNSFLVEEDLRYDPENFNLNENTYLVGFWQSEKYFSEIKPDVRKAFSFPKLILKRNINLKKTLKIANSVSIHVRKGADYKKSIVNETCGVDYYKDAINYISERVENPSFYIFSDNQDWCKSNLNFINAEFIDWNNKPGSDNYIDMQLMSACKHNIIANSSYSWWGAWLNNNTDKIVIGPKKWFSDNSKLSSDDIIPENWIKI